MQETKQWCSSDVWNEVWEYILQDDIAWFDAIGGSKVQDDTFEVQDVSNIKSTSKDVNRMSDSEYRSHEKKTKEAEEMKEIYEIQQGLQEEYYEQVGIDETE